MTSIKSPRDYISPSDLTFLWGECKKCFWLKYRKGISRPGFMPLVGPMSAFQESRYWNQETSSMDSSLPVGVISDWGKTIESSPIIIDGVETRWRIKGKYDVVITFHDGTIGLVDCKVTTGEMDENKIDLYWPQLEAYAFALESPLLGVGHQVSETGLLMWRIVSAETNFTEQNVFNADKSYLSSPRRQEDFLTLMKEVITILEGSMPEAGDKCTTCKFIEKRLAI